jgi:FkbM family methyltransferase
VIDAGAYIGDSTAWYLTKFPEARVIAVEPDPENFRLLEMNCKPYGERVRLVRAALWSKTRRLDLKHTSAWDSVQVGESDGSNECQGVSIPELMQSQGISTVDILKLDIEDAELGLFSSDCDSWLRQIRAIVMEIHSRSSLEAVVAATERQHFSHKVYRNLHFFSRSD